MPLFLRSHLMLGLSASLLAVSTVTLPVLATATTLYPPSVQNQSPRSQSIMLTLERTACFGACPIYKLTIYGNGKVVYAGKRFVTVTGIRTTTISRAAVRQLVAEFQQIHYFGLQDSYTGGHTDAPSAITSLTIGTQHKTVNHYLPSPTAPQRLTALENKIDTVVNVQQWTGKHAEPSPL